MSILFLDISYVTISPNLYCGHKSGGDPAYCSGGVGSEEAQCEASCTYYSWCIAYSFKGSDKECYFTTSTGSCSGATVYSATLIATSIDQLVGHTGYSGFNCKGKIPGKAKYLNNKTQ